MGGRPWTERDYASLREQFPTEKTADLAAVIGRTPGAVGRKAALLGVVKSDGRYQRLHIRYRVNEQSFDQLSPATAYALGLILADGSIAGDRLKITNNRLDVILFTRRALRSNHRVVAPQAPSRAFNLLIRNGRLADGLRQWGICENKSLIGRWPPHVPPQLFGAVVRGYFDGDGYAGYSYRGGLRVKFTSGSSQLLEDLASELAARGLPPRLVVADKGHPNANRLWYYGRDAARLAQIMYGNGEFCICRKQLPFTAYAAARPERVR